MIKIYWYIIHTHEITKSQKAVCTRHRYRFRLTMEIIHFARKHETYGVLGVYLHSIRANNQERTKTNSRPLSIQTFPKWIQGSETKSRRNNDNFELSGFTVECEWTWINWNNRTRSRLTILNGIGGRGRLGPHGLRLFWKWHKIKGIHASPVFTQE